jgi:PPOX class probable F420-dependent enzyme
LNLNQILKIVKSEKVARLATASPNLQPYLTPVVFVLYKNSIFIPLDHKPKSISFKQLKRVKNIQRNRKVAFLVDNYEDDWKKLWFVMLIGNATLVEQRESENNSHKDIRKVHDLLLEKYIQYSKVETGTTYIKISVLSGFHWRWGTKKKMNKKRTEN